MIRGLFPPKHSRQDGRRRLATGAEGARFAISGLAVAIYYVAATTGLDAVMPFQAALVLGYASAVALHFTLQRFFVWRRRGEFALALRHQLWRYGIVALLQYAVTAAITAAVPAAFGASVTVVYVITAVVIAVLNFLVLRRRIFHAVDETPVDRSKRDAVSAGG